MDGTSHIDDLADFVTASPSSYHAAAEVARRLLAAGYVVQLAGQSGRPRKPGRSRLTAQESIANRPVG